MSFELIDKLASKEPDLRRSLAYGYLRGISTIKAARLMKKYALHKPYGSFIIRCLLEHDNRKVFDSLAKHFIACFKKSFDHKEQRRYTYYLDRIFEGCSSAIQKSILKFFLVSGKRYMRKYAYSKKLDKVGLFVIALNMATKYPEEATFLLKTVAYHYDDSFIEKHFDELAKNPAIEEYQLRKLFTRRKSHTREQWEWLKDNSPGSFLYVASIKRHPVSDDVCLETYQRGLDCIHKSKFHPDMLQPQLHGHNGLFLWCLARMGKWKVIEKILNKQKNV